MVKLLLEMLSWLVSNKPEMLSRVNRHSRARRRASNSKLETLSWLVSNRLAMLNLQANNRLETPSKVNKLNRASKLSRELRMATLSKLRTVTPNSPANSKLRTATLNKLVNKPAMRRMAMPRTATPNSPASNKLAEMLSKVNKLSRVPGQLLETPAPQLVRERLQVMQTAPLLILRRKIRRV